MDSRPRALCRLVLSKARDVYAELGWGWREEVYREALGLELRAEGLLCACEVSVPVMYKGSPLGHANVRWDMLVDNSVLVELKAVLPSGTRSARRQVERYSGGTYECLALNFPNRADGEVTIV